MTIVIFWLDQRMTLVMLTASAMEGVMTPSQRLAHLLAGRIHYGWIVVGVMFSVILATVGVRAAPES